METNKITNWVNWQEWKSVVEDAYNEENDMEIYRRALSRLLAWESRDQNVPPALICLKELLIAKLYNIDKKNASIEQIYWYQLTLSMSIVRFVNFITEPFQTNLLAKPIKTIAAEIGLPDWIVNLRHNATHFSLPSVEVLENALDYLYEWLKVHYVNNYKEITVEQSLVQNIQEYIQNIFVDYMNTRYKTTLLKPKSKSLKEKSKKLDQKIEEVTTQFKNETFEILLEDGYMIPTKDQLNAIGIVPEEFIHQDKIDLPKGFLNIWMEFLTYCNENNSLLGVLFQKLVDAYRTESDHSIRMNPLREKFILAWILCLIKLNFFKNGFYIFNLFYVKTNIYLKNFNLLKEKNKFTKFFFEYKLNDVLLDILKGKPGKYCLAFLNELGKLNFLKNLIDLNQFEKLLHLTILISQENMSLNDQVVANGDTMIQTDLIQDYSIYDLDIFESDNNKNKQNERNYSSCNKNFMLKSDWILIDDFDWNHENLKLGLVESQTYDTLNLDMDQFLNKTDKKLRTEHDISINETIQKSSNNSIFTNNKLDQHVMQSLSQKVINNYWQF